MPARKILISVLECQCVECLNDWVTQTNVMPDVCPACGSSEWNEPCRILPGEINNVQGLSEVEKRDL